jgi:hypothetical protein
MPFRVASTATRQRDMFACTFAPQMARLVIDFCGSDQKQRDAKFSELKEMLDAHPQAAEKFLAICNPELPGLGDAKALVDFVRSQAKPIS